MQTNPFKEFGKSAAAAMLDVSQSDLNHLSGYTAVMDSPESEAFDREVCKIAAAAFDSTGAAGGFHSQLYNRLAFARDWSPGFKPFVDCVKRAFVRQQPESADARFVKSALIPEAVGLLHDNLGGDITKTLISLGAVGGAGLGSLGFVLARNARQSSAANAETLEKIKAYNQLRRDIEEDMQSNATLAEASGKKKDSNRTYDV